MRADGRGAGAGGGGGGGAGPGRPGEAAAAERAVRGAVRRALEQALPLANPDTRGYSEESVLAELESLEPPLELLFEAAGAEAGAERARGEGDGDSDGDGDGEGAGPAPERVLFRAFGEILVDLGAAEDDAEARDFCGCLARHLRAAQEALAAEFGDAGDEGLCELCDRCTPLTRHHLVPRTLHKEFRKLGWTKRDLEFGVAMLCRPCHSAVHRHATERELAEEYNTVEKLLEHEKIHAFARYASQQKAPPAARGHDNRLQYKR